MPRFRNTSKKLRLVYKKLYKYFGPQHWWPADSSFEVMVGAILTQNTNWQNVEKAIINLKRKGLLEFSRACKVPVPKLALLIRPSGYYNIKAKRLKCLLEFIRKSYRGNLKKMSSRDTRQLRAELLGVHGVGCETADSILLYALNKPVFVVDSYTKRILLRHALISKDAGYEEVQNLFMQNLKNDVKLFNEYHALLVRLGKEFCLKRRPKCKICPLENQR